MSALGDALTAAQRSALAALEKAYVAEKIDADAFHEALTACGITDQVDQAFLVASLDILKEWGVSAPNLTERLARENGEPERASDKQRQLILDPGSNPGGGMSDFDSLREDIAGIGRTFERVTDAQNRRSDFHGAEIEKLWDDNADLRDELHAVANRLENLTRAVTTDPAEVAQAIVNDANRSTLREVRGEES